MVLLHKINLAVRSFLFSSIVIVTFIIWSVPCVAAWIFPLRYSYKLVAAWTDAMIQALRIVCGIKYEVEGRENIPKDRNGVIFSKHQSTWETFFFPGQFFELAIILKRELLRIPFFGWALASTRPIAINRNKTTTAMEQIMTLGTKCLNEGRWVLVFPEGTRVAPRTTGKYRLGGARLAVKTGHPVLPIAHNAGHFWPRRKFLKHPGTIRVVIGPLIETKGRSAEEVLMEAKNWIEGEMVRIENR